MTPGIKVQGVVCIPAALTALTATELRDAAFRTDGRVRMKLPKRQQLAELKAEGYVRAVNPGSGVILLKS